MIIGRIIISIVLLTSMLWFFGLNAGLSQSAAQEITPEPRPTITPIPRSTLTTETTDSNDSDESLANSRIILQSESETITTTFVTVVQWQDTSNHWIDVDGWRGQFDHQGRVRWWVAPKDFKTGEFRWAIFSPYGNKNEVVWVSESFYLPDSGQMLIIPVDARHLASGSPNK